MVTFSEQLFRKRLIYSKQFTYRPEIDGLRAISIIGVIVYHAKIQFFDNLFFTGGFIGVDVFFVISGYLITGIILNELHNDTFTFRRFYERRIRRILPALLLVQLVTMPFAYLYLLPDAHKEYSGSLIATSLFYSNYFFWIEDSYNAQFNDVKPLLHTWSLSIEKQFYFIFPAILLVFYKFAKKYLLAILMCICLISLHISENLLYEIFEGGNTAFYMIYTRGWELIAGALLAKLETTNSRKPNRILGTIFSIIGLVLVIHAFITFNNFTPHPYYLTLSPIIGVMLLIWFTSPNDVVGRVLSYRLLVSLGLVSYSLYLWHQPVFVFSRKIYSSELPQYSNYLLIGLSVLLASITYRTIEKPTRHKNKIRLRHLMLMLMLGNIIVISSGMYGYFSAGIPSRYPPIVQNVFQKTPTKKITGKSACEDTINTFDFCQIKGKDSNNYGLITLGDSHIQTLEEPIVNNIDLYSYFMPQTIPGCFFQLTFDAIRKEPIKRKCTAEINKNILNEIAKLDKQIVIIGGRLPLYIEHAYFDNQEGGLEKSTNPPALALPGEVWPDYIDKTSIKPAILNTINTLLEHNIKVILVYPIPEVGFNVPEKIVQYLNNSSTIKLASFNKASFSTSYKVFQKRTKSSYNIYDGVPDNKNLIRIYPESFLCNKIRCHTHDTNNIFYKDDDHLSYIGASILLDIILEKMHTKWGVNFSSKKIN